MHVTTANVSASKTPLKCDLISKMVLRYPSIDLRTVQVITHIQEISKNISSIVNHGLAQFGLTEGKFYVLIFLFSEDFLSHDEPSPSQIADHVGITRGTVTGLLDGLERDGFLERVHDSRDRRGLTIRITEKSRQFLDSFLPTIAGTLEQVLPFDAAEKDDVIGSLAKIEAALSAITPAVAETI